MTRLERIPQFRRSLNEAVDGHADGVQRGIKIAALFLQRASMQIVPVQFGILRASSFARHSGRGFRTEGRVGYTAAYAVFVHENMNAAHGRKFNVKHASKIASASTPAQRKVWFQRGPQQQAKFLEKPARELRGEITRIVLREARRG